MTALGPQPYAGDTSEENSGRLDAFGFELSSC